MRHLRSIKPACLCLLLFSLFCGCSSAEGDSNKKETGSADSYTPQVGDVIFQSSEHNDLIDMIEGTSNSHYSHCGIVDQVDGQWVVYEAGSVVKATPLDVFINRGRNEGFAAYRFAESFRGDIPTIIEKTRAYLGRPYDFRYRLDDEYIYCSELIYKAFEQTTGEPLGDLARLGDLKWQPYEALIVQLENGPVPVDRMIITPIDLALAKQFEVVYVRDFEVTTR
ncbi:MAG: YiiX/YebB-like N1pC/P60 family cysteine hydrolase [Phycisphaeraceae bacterium]